MNVFEQIKSKKAKIAIVGLGYVGLPLAVEFGKSFKTIGFDVDRRRIAELKKCMDRNDESSKNEIRTAKFLEFTTNPKRLREAKFIVVAVPTPVTDAKQPDLSFVISASEVVGKNFSRGSIVVFEPTVYPGVTEDICVPLLEKFSKLKYKKDFKVGYSPERINPGDKKHTVAAIIKIVSGCDKESLEEIACIYGAIVKAGIFKARSIKTAEAAKVIENTQRDLNIALMNELALIFHKAGIDTRSVIEAASTKWNFIKAFPGLVGGHCIGVDPYYLTFKAEELGYHPEVILSGRRINDNMGKYVAEETVKRLIQAGRAVKDSKVVVLGVTFKENVSDIRNSRVFDLIGQLKAYGMNVEVSDPMADKKAVFHHYGVNLVEYNAALKAHALVIAVSHDVFKKDLSLDVLKRHLIFTKKKAVLIDVKGMFNLDEFDGTGILYWRL
ncbi:MAG: hypothetical protein AUJ72_04010 [Candidatus Omnitrophica bacterium CG1_02_46_14]|nr:MAG: hypothetical protein AUJ72_04010 [Candidatus Omnitrophica bacterium CG1_02_46_14]